MEAAGVEVRAAGAADVPAVAALEQECFPADAWDEAYLRVVVNGQSTAGPARVRIVLAVDAERGVVGYAILNLVFEIAELQRIGVTAGQRRRGVAARLLSVVREEAAREGAERLLLEVHESNTAAIDFYRGHGFTQIDRRERYYRDGGTALVLEQSLG